MAEGPARVIFVGKGLLPIHHRRDRILLCGRTTPSKKMAMAKAGKPHTALPKFPPDSSIELTGVAETTRDG